MKIYGVNTVSYFQFKYSLWNTILSISIQFGLLLLTLLFAVLHSCRWCLTFTLKKWLKDTFSLKIETFSTGEYWSWLYTRVHVKSMMVHTLDYPRSRFTLVHSCVSVTFGLGGLEYDTSTVWIMKYLNEVNDMRNRIGKAWPYSEWLPEFCLITSRRHNVFKFNFCHCIYHIILE